ncbi:MAG: hypothetical protein CSB06_01835 [Bacteroidia bacterium]|nr:MAG: hypothetical protein CSB06_01835 [Bacteroidia bacterium]
MNIYKKIFLKISNVLKTYLGDRVETDVKRYEDGYEEYTLTIKDADIWITCDDYEIIVGNGYPHLHINEDYGGLKEGLEILLNMFTKKKKVTEFYKGKYCYKTEIEIEEGENKYRPFSNTTVLLYPFWKKTRKNIHFQEPLVNPEQVKQEIEEIKELGNRRCIK